jgi:hypothetical protein
MEGAEEELLEATPSQPTNVTLMELSTLQDYLSRAAPFLLDAEGEKERAEFTKVLKSSDTNLLLNRFISEPKIPVLLIQKTSSKGKPYTVWVDIS